MMGIDIFLLVLLAAIWGSSFIFSRIAAPVVGPLALAELRILLAGIAFLFYFRLVGVRPAWRKNLKHFVIVGLLNFAVPFALFSYAALYIPASYSVILNATVPFWAAIYASLLFAEKFGAKKILGLFLGAFGVVLVSRAGVIDWTTDVALSIVAGLVASASYAASATYVKARASHLSPTELTGGSLSAGGIILAPVLFFTQVHGELDTKVVVSIAVLALVCSGVAFMLFYKLVQRIGTTPAMLVTFLMPVFGMIWGALFLAETITPRMGIGALMILGGMAFLLLKNRTAAASAVKFPQSS